MSFKFTTISTNATYSMDGSLTAVNEGSQVTVTLNTSGVQNGQQIPYTISGTNITTNDFVALPSLTNNFTVQNDIGLAILTLSNDALTEGTESFTVSVPSGDTVSINVNDTSLSAPTYPSTLWRTLANPDPAAGMAFGQSVGISGNYVVVGTNGVAHVFNTTTGSLVSTLSNPSPEAGDYSFGTCVAISGNYAVVGANGSNSTVGAVYVFNAASGVLVSTISNPTPAANDYFGQCVAISGNYVIVGGANDDTYAVNSGSAYLFDATTGSLIRTWTNPTPAIADRFGCSVGISGNYAVVGAYEDDATGSNSGRAYVFNTATGVLVSTLSNPYPAVDDNFGYSVAISDNYVVVGAVGVDAGANGAGAAYVFNATTGALLRPLSNPYPALADAFGISVAISGNYAIIGASMDDTAGLNSGSAYVVDVVTGTLVSVLLNPTPASGDVFGGRLAVAISGSYAVVGAYQDDTTGDNFGSAYIFN